MFPQLLDVISSRQSSQKSDIRKWFMKQHDKGTGNGSMSKNSAPEKPSAEKPSPGNLVQEGQETAGKRKTSKYFATDKVKAKEEKVEEVSAKRKAQNVGGSSSVNEKPPAAKRIHKAEDDDDFVLPASAMGSRGATPAKKSASGSGRGSARKSVISDESDDDLKDTKSDPKPTGRGRGGRAAQTGGKGIPLDESDDDASADKDTKSGG